MRNIDVFNNRVRAGRAPRPARCEPMPYIVVVVDEFADLMIVAGKEIEAAVQRLAQMARAAGIHLIMATQRPSVDVITGTIKANFPTRISFKVASKIDSRTILNEQGAEQLLGQGDMLFSAGTGRTLRVHGPFVSDEEVESIAAYLREQGEPRYIDGITDVADGPADIASGPGAIRRRRSLRASRRHRAGRPEGLHQLPAAPPGRRLQPGRRPDRAHGAGRHLERPRPPGQAPDPVAWVARRHRRAPADHTHFRRQVAAPRLSTGDVPASIRPQSRLNVGTNEAYR